MKALYQTYRPMTFKEIRGQGNVTAILHAQAQAHSFHHAYLMYGASGTGKTTTARVLAMAMNCETMNGTGEPCGQCPACRMTAKGSHWDCLEIDGGRFRRIDDVRDLCYKAYFTPMGKRKVYIVDECHQLTEEAWGAMLKLLEEPPEYLSIILCTTDFAKLPETIVSRCELFPFVKLNTEAVIGKLEYIGNAIGKMPARQVFESIAMRAGGNMRMAENMMQQLCEVS